MKSRFLPLLDERGEFVEDARLMLIGAMRYPNCEQSILHFRNVTGSDENETPGKISEIGQLLKVDARGRKRQGHVVGHVSRNLVEALPDGSTLSLNKAVFLAVEAAKDATVSNKGFKPSTTSAIDKAFRHFKDVCHFWAAQVTDQELFKDIPNNDFSFRKFLMVAADFQEYISATSTIKNWNPWQVPVSLRSKKPILTIPKLSAVKIKQLALYNSEIRLLKKHHLD